MALRIPVGYASIRLDFLRTGEQDEKSITFGVPSADTAGATLGAVLDAWDDPGSMRSLLFSSITLTDATCYKGADGPLTVATLAVNQAGSGLNPNLCSPAVSMVLKKSTGLAGPRYRGRLMLPWCSEADVDSAGVVAGAAVVAWSAAAEVWRGAMAADPAIGGTGMVVLHEESLGAITPTPVELLRLRGTVGTVRRRQILG